MEPDDPEDLCQKCAQEDYEKYLASFIAKGLPPDDKRPYWRSPECWYRARAVVRGMRKHGLVTLPVRHDHAREDWSYMRSEWDGKGMRAWCTCGWNSGWTDPSYRNIDNDGRAQLRAHIAANREQVAA